MHTQLTLTTYQHTVAAIGAKKSVITSFGWKLTICRDKHEEASDKRDFCRSYLKDKSLQLYPVGYGLSVHSKWAVPKLNWTTGQSQQTGFDAAALGEMSVDVTLTNTGSKTGSRPVLLFVERKKSTTSTTAAGDGVNWPNKWLVAFTKAKAVDPGKSQTVTLCFGTKPATDRTCLRIYQ